MRRIGILPCFATVLMGVALQAQSTAPATATPSAGAAASAQGSQTPPAQTAPPAGGAGAGAPGGGQGGVQQNADGTYTIRRNARLVVLDVVVTDKQNNVVTDLTKNDFHVTEAKEVQTIQNFEKTDAHALPPEDATINSTADLDRLAPRAPVNIVLLDEFNTRFEDEAFARYSLKKYLEKQPDKLTVPTMLVAVTLQNFTVLRDYTQNKQEIIEALDHHFVAYPWQVHQYSWLAERYGTAFLTLRRVAEAVMGHPGHKNMIWIGRGFPPLDLRNVPVDSTTRINNEVQNCVDILRDARVTLYTIDPAGLQVNNTYGSAAEFNDPFGGNYQFSALAKATGGKTMYGRNDVDAEITNAARDGAAFYTLTYRPTDDSRDPAKFRKIQVTVDRPGVTISTREGYYLQRRPAAVNTVAPSRRLVSDLISADSSNMTYDGVGLKLATVEGDPDDFVITVDAKSVNWSYATATDPRKAQVVLVVSTFDKKNKELKREGKTITASAPPETPPTGRLERPVMMRYKVEHDNKAVRVRFVVRVSATGRIGTLDYDLVKGGAPTVSLSAPVGAAGPAPAPPK